MEFRVLSGAFARDESEPSGFQVMSVTGEEAMSELFSFDAVVLADPHFVEEIEHHGGIEHALIMADVMMRLGPEGDVRYGMVSEVDLEGPFTFHDRVYARMRVRVVPRAWLLTQRRNSRIFQHKYLHEIVSAVLHENGVRHRWDLRKTYPRRIYCTQYEETDYDFVRRILAEEGVFFFFESRREFEGGHAAEIEAKETDLDKAVDKIEKGSKILKSASKEAKNIAKKTGNQAEEGAFDALGGAAGLAGDAASAVGEMFGTAEDEEAPMPRVLGGGEAGPSGNGDVFVFADDAPAYVWGYDEDDSREVLQLRLRDEGGMVGDRHQIDRLAYGYKTRPEHVETRDYDFRRPLLELKARVGEPLEEEGEHGHGDPPPGLPLEIYDHHGEYNIEDISDEGAQLQREQYRRDAAVAHGRGRSARLAPGHKFRLSVIVSEGREVLAPENDYAVTRVHHQYENPDFGSGEVDGVVQGCARAIREALVGGRDLPENELRQIIKGMDRPGGQPRIYQNRFDCVAWDVAFRPPRPKRLVRHVTETATVMGPTGQDIYQDRYGRVKVQFHWDRQGKWDDNTSCWLRVAQPWAGAGYGFQFFPRVGMEVLVTFIGGDTDRPVVVGALYNGTHATPEVLPERMTRSGIRTQSSPKGGGFNELSFEDQSENERIYLHAQRNLEKTIQHDHHVTVGNRHSFSIGGDQRGGIGGNQRFSIGGDRSTSVGGNEASFVEGSRTSRVLTNQLQMVGGSSSLVVGGTNLRRVQQSDLTSVKGVYNVTARAGASFIVTGGVDTNTSATAFVKGSAYLTASQRVVVRTKEEEDPAVIRFECGKSSIELHPDHIVIDSEIVWVRARKEGEQDECISRFKWTGGSIVGRHNLIETPNQKACLRIVETADHSSAVAMLRGDDLEIRGSRISYGPMNTPTGTPDSSDDAQHDPNVTLQFTHHALEHSDPIADTPYRAVAGDRTYEGRTNDDGQISIYVPEEIKSVDVSLFAHEQYADIYPDPMPLRYNVALVGELPEISEHRGAAVRLKNLGYHLAVPFDEHDPSFIEALTAFQLDHKLPETGENDEATQEKLREVYGA